MKFNKYLENKITAVSHDGINWVKPKSSKKKADIECPSCGAKIPHKEINDYGQKRCPQCGVLVGGMTK